MEYRRLGDSELRISAISFGCAGFSAAGPSSAGEAKWIDEIVGVALDEGINLFDTAQTYGHGISEERLGMALKGRRDRAMIATKMRDFERWEKEDMLARLDGSLKRLGTDHVDLYQMHWPLTVMSEKAAEAMIDAFDAAIKSGKTRAVGVSNFKMEHLRMIPPEGLKLLAGNQIPLSLLNRSYLEGGEVEFCRKHGIGILVYSPLEGGVLAGKHTRANLPVEGDRAATSGWFREDRLEKTLRVIDSLVSASEKLGCSPSQAALRWLLDAPGVASTITASRSPENLRMNLGAIGVDGARLAAMRL